MLKTFIARPVAALALTLGLFSNAHAADAPLKIGTTAAFAIPLEAAVSEAKKQGLTVDLIEFSDWIAPNVSLASGDIDEEAFGIVLYRPSEQDTRTIGTAATAVAAGEEGAVLEEGKILVEWSGAQPAYGDTVYVGFAVGEEGKLYNGAGTSRVAWARAKFLGQGRDSLTYVWLRAS